VPQTSPAATAACPTLNPASASSLFNASSSVLSRLGPLGFHPSPPLSPAALLALLARHLEFVPHRIAPTSCRALASVAEREEQFGVGRRERVWAVIVREVQMSAHFCSYVFSKMGWKTQGFIGVAWQGIGGTGI